MKELPCGWFLNQLLAKNLVDEKEINRVIARLHQFYESETPKPEIQEWGTPEKLKISTDENFTQAEPFVGKPFRPLPSKRFAISHTASMRRRTNYSLSHFNSTTPPIPTATSPPP